MTKEALAIGELQELDTRLDALRDRLATLPEQDRYDSARSEMTALHKTLARFVKQKEEAERTVKKLEGALDRLEDKIKHEEAKLYAGNVRNPKELMSIQAEIVSIRKEKDREETDYLTELEAFESLARALSEMEDRERDLSQTVEELREVLDGRTTELQAEIDELDRGRSIVVKRVPGDILNLYDKLRKDKQGLAVARVIDGICQGCNIELTSQEDDALSDEELSRCRHCRRIIMAND